MSSLGQPATFWSAATSPSNTSLIGFARANSLRGSTSSHRSTGSIGSYRGTPTRSSRNDTLPTTSESRNVPKPDLRQWSSNSIEWVVRDLSVLQAQEAEHATDQDISLRDREILQAFVADGRFRLDVVLSKFDPEDCSHTEAEDLKHLDPVPPPTISLNLYLALVDADQVSVEDPLFTTIFIGIKSQASSISGMGISRDPWIWQNWEEWAFHAEAEYFRCALPPLSTLIDDPTIAEQDAFTLFIQLQMPNAPQIHPLKPGLQVVPSDLVEGFAASLDNKNTGDVRFVCLEYRNPQSELDVDEDTNGSVDPLTTESTATSIASDGLVYRKRTLYAHADILRARSEYFRDLLDFQEVTASVGPARPTQRLGTSSDRKIQTVHCNDTDFQTLYWTLRYIYQNDLDFARNGDVRKVVERSNATSDFRARRLIGGDGVMPLSDEWEWHTSSKSGGSSTSVSVVGANDTDDIRTMRSGISASSTGTSLGRAMQSSIHSLTDGRSRSISRNHVVQSTPVNNDTPGTSRTRPTGLPISRSNNPEARSAVRSNGRAAGTTSASRQGHRASSTISTPQAPSTEISPSSSRIYPLQYPSGAAVSSPVAIKIKDPHPHPTSPPPPASSFAIFSLAHRYRLLDLQQLAQGDLMERLTPGTACSLLLASFKYDELHLQAQEYVVENWTAIQEENAFLTSIQEVSNGLWGSDGGLVLHSLFRQLRT